MSNQDKYDQLTEIIDKLDVLVDDLDETYFKDYISDLKEIKYQAENDREEIEEDLIKEQEAEEKEMNYQYERSVL